MQTFVNFATTKNVSK